MNGGLASSVQYIRKDRFLNKEAAMSLYEILDLLLQAIVILLDIITRLPKKRKKGKRIKKWPA